MALTLETRVPADWKTCQVEQGGTRSECPITDGVVRYDGVPGRGVIVIHRR
jgi:hypothetical protein